MTAHQHAPLPEKQVHLILKALADPRRYEILKHLGEFARPMPCGAMRRCTEISPATLSHHMKELETAGLVEPVREGRSVSYLLQREVLKAFLDQIKADVI